MERGNLLEILLHLLGLVQMIHCQQSYISLKSLGCWRDHPNKMIPTLEGSSSILNGYYKGRTDAVQKCARVALNRGYRVFVVQDSGWCGSSVLAHDKYQKLGRSTRCRRDGTGGFRSNEVYEIVGRITETPGRVSGSRPLVVQPEYVFQDGKVARPHRQGSRSRVYGSTTSRNGQQLVAVSSSNVRLENEPRSNQLSVHAFILNDLGCWAVPARGIRSLEGDLTELDGHYRYRLKAVQKCAKAAGRLEFEIIALHDGGKCLAVSDIEAIYKSNGKRNSCSYTGKGAYSAIQVYEIRYSKTRDPPPPIDETETTARTPRATTTTRQTSATTRPPPRTRPTVATRITRPQNQPILTSGGLDYLHLTDLGCWSFAWNDSIPSIEGSSAELDGHYSQRINAVQKCAKVAAEFGYDVFAIQDGGRCASSQDARRRFSAIGMSTYCREDGKGGSWVNQVYEVNIVWDVQLNGLGCFASGATNPITSLEDSTDQLDGDYYRRDDAIRKCAMAAARRYFDVFALHDDGKCLSDAGARTTHAQWGRAGTCSNNGRGGHDANEVYEVTIARQIRLSNLGCWKDKPVRSVPSMEQTDGDLMDNYKIRKDAIGKCARAAYRSGFTVFVIQDGGWCGGSFAASSTYSTYGRSNLCRSDGEGGYQANQVYELEEV